MSEKTQSAPTGITSYQVWALVALTFLNMQDGFDILAISYAANAIATNWDISRGALGIVLSASLFGMMIGAMTLSPLADKFGRRTITVVGLILSGIGMLIAMSAGSIELLIAGRVITGLGIGGILASVNTLVAEFAGEKYRSTAIAIFQLGFPMGAFLSGFLVAWLLDIGTWRHVFAFGALSSFIFIPIVLLLPESMEYLAKSGKPDALRRINNIRAKLRQPALHALPVAIDQPRSSMLANILTLFNREYALRTALIWASFFLLLTTLYFMLSWIPKILVDTGFTEAQGNQGGRLINLVGMLGIVVMGVLSLRVQSPLVTSVYLVMLAGMMFLLSITPLEISSVLIVIGLIGFFLHGSMIGLYATVPTLYPASIRATGTGWAIGLSRFGAVLGPAMAGYLLEAGWAPRNLLQVFAIPAGLAAVTVFLLWQAQRRVNPS
ncbi:MAG: MFS transporter [Robiginitomaculum sp.]|nr:MFS transporter [Robiginitomaculum sp.]